MATSLGIARLGMLLVLKIILNIACRGAMHLMPYTCIPALNRLGRARSEPWLPSRYCLDQKRRYELGEKISGGAAFINPVLDGIISNPYHASPLVGSLCAF